MRAELLVAKLLELRRESSSLLRRIPTPNGPKIAAFVKSASAFGCVMRMEIWSRLPSAAFTDANAALFIGRFASSYSFASRSIGWPVQ